MAQKNEIDRHINEKERNQNGFTDLHIESMYSLAQSEQCQGKTMTGFEVSSLSF